MSEQSPNESLHCENEQPGVDNNFLSTPKDTDIDRQTKEIKDILSRYSEPSSLDYSPSSSVFESEELDCSIFENDSLDFERESGVESVDGDWLQACHTPPSDYELDLTEEQALETLKYFTMSLSRANQMTKTHQDLDAVLQLLQEKEKDLELAAHIGQSLLERNRNLFQKTEVLENYVNEVEERETQLKHVVTMKDKLLKTFNNEDIEDDDGYSPSESSAYESCRDESMMSLHEKCNHLEAKNTNLVLEALKLREETDKEEEKEKELVYECIKELANAKDQINHLTDEVSLKAEDNVQQQEEISKLISTVVELQERHNYLTEENEGLHETLKNSQENQQDLKVEVSTLHDKYQECFEMLIENQREMKMMKEKICTKNDDADSDSCPGLARQDPRDSLALEIEETVRRDLETSQDKKKHTNRVMQTVRAANTTKRFPKAIKGGARPGKVAQAKSAEKPFDFTFAASGNSSSKERSEAPSMNELRAAVRRLSVSENAAQGNRSRRSWAPEKLQIVKPMEGSATLHKWQSLAQPTMSGLHNVLPGVHVKGETSEHVRGKSTGASGRAEPKHKNQTVGDNNRNAQKKPDNPGKKDIKNKTGVEEKLGDATKRSSSKGHLNAVTKTTSTTSPTTRKPAQTTSKMVSTTGDVTSGTSSDLTEIVKSKLSAGRAVIPDSEPGMLLNIKILRSTAGISTNLVTSMPVTTTAKTSFVPTTTTSSAMNLTAFPRPRLVRSRSSENLLNFMKPFNQNVNAESTTTTPSISSGGIGVPTTTHGFGGFVGRLVRSPSNENLAGTGTGASGLTRSSSSGKLSDMLKNSDILGTIGKASSFDSVSPNKRASFHLGDSPPSPSRLEMMGDLGDFALFGPSTSSTPATESTTTVASVASSTSRSMFGALSGLGRFFRPRSKSLDNLGPLPTFSAPSPKVGSTALVERTLERFNQVFGPD